MSKAKVVTKHIKLMVKAGQAKPGPPIGPALGQAGLNIMSFCKDFNAKTAHIKDDVPIPVKLSAYSDKTFTYEMKSPPTTFFLKKAAGIEQAAQKPGHETKAEILVKHVYEIAVLKQKDSPLVSLEALSRSIVGTCRSMGIKVVPLDETAKPQAPAHQH